MKGNNIYTYIYVCTRRSMKKFRDWFLLVFFDIRGIVHHEFDPEDQTVNAEFFTV
jgi:hypothetical protein